MSDMKDIDNINAKANKVEDVDCEDEFEEFPVENWDAKDDTPTEALWATNWDDDDADQDFVAQLRAELGLPKA